MVAGISSRFGGKNKAFSIVGPNNEMLIEYSLKQALPAGFSKIFFIVGNKTQADFKNKFSNSYNGVPVFYALQTYDEKERDKPWGTVDAIVSLRGKIDCPFVICNGDDLYGSEPFALLFEHLSKIDNEATVGYTLSEVIPEIGRTNRGIFQVKDNFVTSLKEVFDIEKGNLAASGTKSEDLASMNLFALHPEILEKLAKIFEDFKKIHLGDRKSECLLPVELSRLIENNEIKMKLYKTKDKWLGVTNPGDENKAKEEIIRLGL
jgi:NDP-sugar pyrophosphorylase family protein